VLLRAAARNALEAKRRSFGGSPFKSLEASESTRGFGRLHLVSLSRTMPQIPAKKA